MRSKHDATHTEVPLALAGAGDLAETGPVVYPWPDGWSVRSHALRAAVFCQADSANTRQYGAVGCVRHERRLLAADSRRARDPVVEASCADSWLLNRWEDHV